MTHSRTYQFGSSTLTVAFGDIVTAAAQVIVSSDDYYITMGGGVSAAILKAGGAVIALDAAKKTPAAIGDVVVTTAGTLSAQYVFHAVTIGPNPDALSHKVIVERTTRQCMRLLDDLRLSSIAFPAIGGGVAGFSIEDVAATMAEVIAEELAGKTRPVQVHVYLFDRFGSMKEIDFVRFFEEFALRVPRVAQRETDAAPASSTPSPVDLASQTKEENKKRRIHYLRLNLAALEDQRGKLEGQLIALLGTGRAADEEPIRRGLKENQELRLQYLNELQSYIAEPDDSAAASRPAAPLTVFVSSTSMDLVSHRKAVKDAIARCDLFYRGMEHFGADPERLPPATLIVEEVRKADVYLGIFGVRYGSVDAATGLSMTELEFREAERSDKPMLMYVMHQEASVPVAHIESDVEGQRKLAALKGHILSKYVPYLFRTTEDLQRQSEVDLAKLKTAKADV